MTVEDFILSATVSADSVSNPTYSLGEKIYYAVKATRDAVGCNTNLGIILLAAPLMQAYCQRQMGQSLRDSLQVVLANTTLQDAEWAFKAITLAAPGGLGKSEQQDVNQTPEVTLLQAMQIASPKDRIALQYTNGFKDIFDFSVLQYNRAFVLSGESSWSALSVFAELLAKFPDSHIERKFGSQYSEWIAAEMATLCEALNNAGTLDELMPMLHRLDQTFKAKRINPGTTADLTVATLLVVFLEKLI
jgi:triphosphoribosyl-dephospho-CoA synthase